MFVNNYYRFCCNLLIYWICHFHYYFISCWCWVWRSVSAQFWNLVLFFWGHNEYKIVFSIGFQVFWHIIIPSSGSSALVNSLNCLWLIGFSYPFCMGFFSTSTFLIITVIFPNPDHCKMSEAKFLGSFLGVFLCPCASVLTPLLWMTCLLSFLLNPNRPGGEAESAPSLFFLNNF